MKADLWEIACITMLNKKLSYEHLALIEWTQQPKEYVLQWLISEFERVQK